MPDTQTDQDLIAQLFDTQPDSVVWFIPVLSSARKISDFEVGYCNVEASRILNAPKEKLVGSLLRSSPFMDEVSRTRILEQCTEVWNTGKQLEFTYYSPFFNKYFNVLRSKISGGILSVTRDRTDLVRSERELDAIFNSSLSGAYSARAVRDTDGKVTDLVMLRANESFYRVFSLDAEKVIGKTLSSISADDSQEQFLQLVEQALESGKAITTEIFYERPARWFAVSMSGLDRNTISVTVNDITEQKNTIADLQQQKSLVDNILLHSANGISVIQPERDAKGNITGWRTVLANEAATRIIGLQLEELLHNKGEDISSSSLGNPAFSSALQTLETGEPSVTLIHLPWLNKWVEITISRLDEEHLINIFTDVTRTRESQVQLEKMVEELKRSNANLEEFTYAASHDLKEPIRKVHYFADRLRNRLEDRLEEEEKQMFHRMQNATERMRLLVDDLLEYSHATLRPKQMEEIDLNQKIKLVLSDLELQVRERNAIIELGELPVIMGHRRQIQQLFQNIIGNALKYSRTDIQPLIKISSRKVKGADVQKAGPEPGKEYHVVEVSDNGIGFATSDADRIFNVFTRLHGNNEYMGTGVGLSIARKVVENHKGFITAYGEPGKGAKFSIYLPAC